MVTALAPTNPIKDFKTPSALRAAEDAIGDVRNRMREIASELGEIAGSLSTQGIVASRSAIDARRDRLMRRQSALNDERTSLAQRELDFAASVAALRTDYRIAISNDLVAARRHAARRLIDAFLAVQQAHADLESLRISARSAGINVKHSLLPLHLDAAVSIAEAIEREQFS